MITRTGSTSFSGDGTTALFDIHLDPPMADGNYNVLLTPETQDFTLGWVCATHSTGTLRIRFTDAPPIGSSFVVHYALFE